MAEADVWSAMNRSSTLIPRLGGSLKQGESGPSAIGPSSSKASSGKFQMKVALLGNTRTGKTSLFNRFLYGQRPSMNTSVTGLKGAVGDREMKRADGPITLALWDTAGQEKYVSVASTMFKNADCILLCYDMVDAESFAKLDKWFEEVKNEADPMCVKHMVIVGTKADLIIEGRARATEEEAVETYRRRKEKELREGWKARGRAIHIDTHETSSMANQGIEDLFAAVAKAYEPKVGSNGMPGAPDLSTRPMKLDEGIEVEPLPQRCPKCLVV